MFVLFPVLIFARAADALPTWPAYRTLPDAERAVIDHAITTLTSKISPTGFKDGHVRFCRRGVNIWETSMNASCDTTRAAAVKQSWPPLRTQEGLSFSWTAHARFVSSYCDLNRDEPSCADLGLAKPLEARRGRLDLFTWFFLGESARAADVCKVEDDQIMLKSGATIFLDFGAQPGQTHANALSELARTSAVASIPEPVIKDGVDSLLKIGKVLTSRLKDRTPWVQDHVKKDKVVWIGTELSEAELGDRTGKKFAAGFDELRDQLSSRKTVKPSARDVMTIGACPTAPACVWLQDPQLRSGVTLVPLASDELKKQALKLHEDEAAILSDLQILVTAVKLSKDEYTAIEREYRNLLIAEDPPDSKARAKARTRYSVPEVSKAMVALYGLAVQLKKNQVDRNRAIVDAAVAQPGNGILAMGALSRDTFVPLLEDACRGPVPSAPAPAAGANGNGRGAAKPKRGASAPTLN